VGLRGSRPARAVRRRLDRLRGPQASITPARPQHRHVVVVTYGRSGSTLVQGLLNALPRTLVRGENNLYVLPLFRAYAAVVAFRRQHLTHNPRADHSAFYGLHEVRPESFVRNARGLVGRHLVGSESPGDYDVLGFKEVAWHRIRDDELAPFFDYLDRVLPECRFVLNSRAFDDVVVSGYWKGNDLDQVTRKIRRVEQIQQFLRDTRPERVLDVRYEDLCSNDPAVADASMRALAEFTVGTCDEALLQRLRETARVGHGPFPFGASRTRDAGKVRPDARPPG
jgi:hypothetical protein